jgi:hypothetical protein
MTPFRIRNIIKLVNLLIIRWLQMMWIRGTFPGNVWQLAWPTIYQDMVKDGQTGDLAQNFPENPNPTAWPSVLSKAAENLTVLAAGVSGDKLQNRCLTMAFH